MIERISWILRVSIIEGCPIEECLHHFHVTSSSNAKEVVTIGNENGASTSE